MMAYYPRSCNKHACILVPPLQTTVVLLASFMLAVAAEAPPGGYSFGLTDARDATTLSAPSNGGGAPPAPAERRFSLHYSLRDREYLMEVSVDGKDQKYRAVADTGSSLIWLKPPRTTQDARHLLNCKKSLLCAGPSYKCVEGGKRCSYNIKYGSSHTRGSMFEETLISQSQPQEFVYAPKKQKEVMPNIAIGWSDEDADTYNGIVGLGRGKQSLVNQLRKHTLSYCLATYDDKADDQKSKLIIGGSDQALKMSACTKPSMSEDDGHGRCKVHTTPLLHPDSELYVVRLESIKIGGEPTDQTTANMFIDSGASFTHLEDTAYQALVGHVDKAMPDNTKKVDYGSTVCWRAEPDLNKLGELELHFAEPAVIYLKKDKFMYDEIYDEQHGHKQVCLAIKRLQPERKFSVLGNFQQQNLHMHFDISEKGGNKLSFVRVDDCSKVA